MDIGALIISLSVGVAVGLFVVGGALNLGIITTEDLQLRGRR